MTNMLDRAVKYMERDNDPGRVFTLNELRRAAGVALRSQYRLADQLLGSGMVERNSGGYRFHAYLHTYMMERKEAGP